MLGSKVALLPLQTVEPTAPVEQNRVLFGGSVHSKLAVSPVVKIDVTCLCLLSYLNLISDYSSGGSDLLLPLLLLCVVKIDFACLFLLS